MALATALSHNDRRVLSALLDADESTTADATGHITDSDHESPTASIINIQRREVAAIQLLSAENVSHDRITDAIKWLSGIIEEYPDYASAWNNRAQAVRLLVGDDLLMPRAAQSTLYSDLCEAIRLASSQDSKVAVSKRSARVLAASYTHRAFLLYKCSKIARMYPEKLSEVPLALRGADATMLEDLAAADFRHGGMYGDPMGNKMAVQLNPYAKLCGEIVREAMINDMRNSEGAQR